MKIQKRKIRNESKKKSTLFFCKKARKSSKKNSIYFQNSTKFVSIFQMTIDLKFLMKKIEKITFKILWMIGRNVKLILENMIDKNFLIN